MRFYRLLRQAADFTIFLTPKGQGYLLSAPTEPCVQHSHICRVGTRRGSSFLQSPVLHGEDPAESFPGGFLGMQDSNIAPADVRGPPVRSTSSAWPLGGTAWESGRGGSSHTTHAVVKDHEAEAKWVDFTVSSEQGGRTGAVETSATMYQWSHSFGLCNNSLPQEAWYLTANPFSTQQIWSSQIISWILFVCLQLQTLGLTFVNTPKKKKKQWLRDKILVCNLTRAGHMNMHMSLIPELCTDLFKHRTLLLEGKQLRKHPTNLNQMVGTVLILFSVMLSVSGNLLQCQSGK